MSAPHLEFTTGLPARWLPRAIAGSVLAAGLLAAARVGSHASVPGAGSFRGLLIVAAAVAALWIVRTGGEVRLRVEVDDGRLHIAHRGRAASLEIAEVEAIRYDSPFSVSRSWLPATVLVDRAGREWRLSALLRRGEVLVRTIADRAGRADLSVWIEAQRIDRRMARASVHVIAGYGLASLILLASGLYALR